MIQLFLIIKGGFKWVVQAHQMIQVVIHIQKVGFFQKMIIVQTLMPKQQVQVAL